MSIILNIYEKVGFFGVSILTLVLVLCGYLLTKFFGNNYYED